MTDNRRETQGLLRDALETRVQRLGVPMEDIKPFADGIEKQLAEIFLARSTDGYGYSEHVLKIVGELQRDQTPEFGEWLVERIRHKEPCGLVLLGAKV